jgi:hypothetical protein
MADTERSLVVHALEVAGLASADDLIEITGHTDLAPVLDELVAAELVELRTGRVGGYALTGEGRGLHPRLVAAAVTEDERSGLGRTDDAFVGVDGHFKEVCTRWQIRSGPDGVGAPDDHSDETYDASVVEELEEVPEKAVAALAPAAVASPRFGRDEERLTAALDRVKAGDRAAVARPMNHSHHDVRMELHEDLLLSRGRERDAADGH